MWHWDWIGNKKYKNWAKILGPIHFIFDLYENKSVVEITLDWEKYETLETELIRN